jgi:hypothetical protein
VKKYLKRREQALKSCTRMWNMMSVRGAAIKRHSSSSEPTTALMADVQDKGSSIVKLSKEVTEEITPVYVHKNNKSYSKTKSHSIQIFTKPPKRL